MKKYKENLVLLSMEDDKVFMTHRTQNVQMKIDVTTIFNFGMFVQQTLSNPNDTDVQKYIDEHFK
jgi:hypothetical protein